MARKKNKPPRKSGELRKMIDKTRKVTKKKKFPKNKKNDILLVHKATNEDEILHSSGRKNRTVIATSVSPECKEGNNNIIQEDANQNRSSPAPNKRNSESMGTSKSCPVHGVKFVIDESDVNADFIPLTTQTRRSSITDMNSKRLGRNDRVGSLGKKTSETIVSCSTSANVKDPVTITVDEDDDDSDDNCHVTVDDDDDDCHVTVCIDDTDCCSDIDSMNDSVQIVKEMNSTEAQNYSSKIADATNNRISLSKKRKLDDSIEILEFCNPGSNRSAKKRKKMAKVDSSPRSSNSVIEIVNESQKNNNNNEKKQDDDIVIVDTIDNNSRDSVMVLNDPAPSVKTYEILREKRKNKIVSYFVTDVNVEQRGGSNPHFSSVFHDTVGNAQMSSARYRSPLSGASNKESDQSVSYYNINGNNMYNPNSVQKTGLRPVVIDGSNVAFSHGGKSFSTRGLEICVNYFVKRGHWVVAFVPLFRRSEVSDADRKILDDLQSKRQLAFTPSRFLHGRRVASYDDRFIVQCAAELGGIVVSTDNYRDLVCENEAWRETIERRLLMFTWVGDILMFPDDPNGRGGPRLEEFLRFPQ